MTTGELADTAPRGPGMETNDGGGASVLFVVGGAALVVVLLGVIIRVLRKRTS